jgi:hypothetical protein
MIDRGVGGGGGMRRWCVPVIMQRGGYIDDDATRELKARKRGFTHVEGAKQVDIEHGFESIVAEVIG